MNLTMICEFLNSSTSQTWYNVGNKIFLEIGSNKIEYKFNSDGILTTTIAYLDDIKYGIVELERSSELEISFGTHYILLSVIIISVITIIIKKRNRL